MEVSHKNRSINFVPSGIELSESYRASLDPEHPSREQGGFLLCVRRNNVGKHSSVKKSSRIPWGKVVGTVKVLSGLLEPAVKVIDWILKLHI